MPHRVVNKFDRNTDRLDCISLSVDLFALHRQNSWRYFDQTWSI